MSDSTYYVISIVATVMGFTLTIVSLWFVYRQVVVSIRTRETDVLIKLYEISTQEPLYSQLDKAWEINNRKVLTSDQKEACVQACLFFEMLGTIVSQQYMNTLLVEEYFGSLITGCYDSLRNFIEVERSKPYNDQFAINFERLAQALSSSERISRTPGKHRSLPKLKKEKERKAY